MRSRLMLLAVGLLAGALVVFTPSPSRADWWSRTFGGWGSGGGGGRSGGGDNTTIPEDGGSNSAPPGYNPNYEDYSPSTGSFSQADPEDHPADPPQPVSGMFFAGPPALVTRGPRGTLSPRPRPKLPSLAGPSWSPFHSWRVARTPLKTRPYHVSGRVAQKPYSSASHPRYTASSAYRPRYTVSSAYRPAYRRPTDRPTSYRPRSNASAYHRPAYRPAKYRPRSSAPAYRRPGSGSRGYRRR